MDFKWSDTAKEHAQTLSSPDERQHWSFVKRLKMVGIYIFLTKETVSVQIMTVPSQYQWQHA